MFKYVLALIFLFSNQAISIDKKIIRVGHFPNVTHAQGVIGHAHSRQGDGWFERYLGPNVEIEWYVYTDGPSAMEALLSQAIDLTYVGPSPSINAYLKSEEEIRILCGSCSKGAALVVQPNEKITTPKDFKGKKLGTPQFGSTQDISARYWLKANGLNVTLTDGDIQVLPIENPDQLMLFQQKDIDAVWTIEPWVSELIILGGGKILFEESKLWPETHGQYVTTHLVSNKKFLEVNPTLIKKWIIAHIDLTDWINTHTHSAKKLFKQEIKEETKQQISLAILDRAWEHINLTYDPIKPSLFRYANEAYTVGFFKKQPILNHIYALEILEKIIQEKKLASVQ